MDQQPKSELTVLRDYLGAVAAVRRARTIFLLIVILSLLAHIGAYCLGRWGPDMADRLQSLSTDKPGASATTAPSATTSTSAPATGPAGAIAKVAPKSATQPAPRSEPEKAGGVYAERHIELLLPMARFAGLAASGLLIMTYLIGVNICLGGRMGGLCHATSAFFWSIVLVALLFPWRHIVPGMSIELPDAFFDMEQLRRGLGDLPRGTLAHVLHYGRYIGCPVLAILAALVSGVRFGLAYRQVKRAVEPLIEMKVV